MITSWWYISNITSLFFNLMSKAQPYVNLKQSGKQEEERGWLEKDTHHSSDKGARKTVCSSYPPPKLAIVSYRTKTCTGEVLLFKVKLILVILEIDLYFFYNHEIKRLFRKRTHVETKNYFQSSFCFSDSIYSL